MLPMMGWNRIVNSPPSFLKQVGRWYQSFIHVNKLGVTVWYRSIGVLGLVVKLQGGVLLWCAHSFPFN